jgi:hypothetical protein
MSASQSKRFSWKWLHLHAKEFDHQVHLSRVHACNIEDAMLGMLVITACALAQQQVS